MERRLSTEDTSTVRLLERLKDVFRFYGYEPLDLALEDEIRSAYRDEFGAEPHDDTVAWFNFAAEVNEPLPPGASTSDCRRCPGQLIAPMMLPYTFTEGLEQKRVQEGVYEGWPSPSEVPAFRFRDDGRPDFALIGNDVTGFHYCLSPSSSDLGPPRLFFLGEGSASFSLGVPGAFDDSLPVSRHEDMPTLRLYLEALVRAYHERQLVILDLPFPQISPNTHFPWPNCHVGVPDGHD